MQFSNMTMWVYPSQAILLLLNWWEINVQQYYIARYSTDDWHIAAVV